MNLVGIRIDQKIKKRLEKSTWTLLLEERCGNLFVLYRIQCGSHVKLDLIMKKVVKSHEFYLDIIGWYPYLVGHIGEEVCETNRLQFEFGWQVNFLAHTIEQRHGNSFILYGIQWKNKIEWDIGKENFANSLILCRIWLILVFTSK